MWIIRDVEKQCEKSGLPVFCKKFSLDKQVVAAKIRISALGIFLIKINGRVIDDYFMPGWTNYNRYVNLCSYDITGDLQKENLIEITLAEGWYSGRVGYTKRGNTYGTVNALFAEIELFFADGYTKRICTDETWKVARSNVITASIFDGEHVDFRVKAEDFANLPFAKAYPCEVPLDEYSYEPVKKIDELTPVVLLEKESIVRLDEETEQIIRLDFKQNFAGFVRFKAQGSAGTEISIKHAEMLNPDGTLYYDNLRSVKAEDKIILSGKEDGFDPKFTFHGFRYAEISIKGNAKIYDIKGVVLSQNIKYVGKFECSNEIINGVYKNALWGQKSNFISVPMDCPQRDERLGWTGDAQVFCDSAMFNGDCNRFFANYLKLIRTDALPDGKIPSFAPFFIPVSVSTAGVPGWADAICVIPYSHYLHYHDVNVLKENLPCAVKHLEYYLQYCENYLLKVENPFGDWLSVYCAQDKEGISQCFLGLSALLISKIYAVLGDEENAAKYNDIYMQAKRAFRANYMFDGGVLVGDSQTIYALSLAVGYVTAEEIKEPFLKSIERNGWKITTGFIGVKYILPAICEIGETDLAYQIIKETEYPSWGYTIKQGATTIWERWNGYTEEYGFETPDMNSFNHYSLGSCVEWLYSYVLGVKLSMGEKIVVSPSLSKELAFAKGECMTHKGKVAVEWKYIDGEYRVKIAAEKDVLLEYDFSKYEIVSIDRMGNVVNAVLR